ncbi:uncharacterized protein LOC113336913 [Papaver somniferum]|uniref:uncharacterized protein LOC113336913 n=1 Tax=Papaver somniferum TaxID=3469 RepID=UPI000E6FC028|nr:uncharacterized protein LOC113336913 [Papaver somniferum]
MDLVGDEAVEENLVVGEKRVVDCDESENLNVKLKKARVDYGGDMKRVAEIVLVLSAMGKMRGGRNPTDVEKGLMVEAKDKLVEICQFMSPQDVIPKDAIRVVMEDLGLNKSADQRLGFCPHKMSISAKLVLAKRKTEESKKFAAQSGTYTLPIAQEGYGTKADANRPFRTVHKPPALGGFQAASSVVHVPSLASPVVHVPSLASPVHKPPALGGFQAASSVVHAPSLASPVVHVPSLASPVLLNQLHVNKLQSALVSIRSIGTSSGPVSSSSQLPRKEGASFRLDGRLNGTIRPFHVQANASGNHSTFSPQSLAATKVCQGNAALDNTRSANGTTEVSTYKVAVQVTRDQNSKPSVQTVHRKVSHQPTQVTNYQYPSSVFSNPSVIGTNAQKFLHHVVVRETKRRIAQRQRRERERAEKKTETKIVKVIDEDRRLLGQRQRRERERAEKEERLAHRQRQQQEQAEKETGKVNDADICTLQTPGL